MSVGRLDGIWVRGELGVQHRRSTMVGDAKPFDGEAGFK